MPTRPTTQLAGPLACTVSTRMGSLKSGARENLAGAEGSRASHRVEPKIKCTPTWLTSLLIATNNSRSVAGVGGTLPQPRPALPRPREAPFRKSQYLSL